MKTTKKQPASAGRMPRLVRLLHSMWDDVGISPKDALMAFTAGIIMAMPVTVLICATAWCLCKWTSEPMDDNAFMASVGLWFVVFMVICAIEYLREKWRESGKPNTQAQPPQVG